MLTYGGMYYSAVDNKLYLGNDTNSGWIGGYNPGSANTIQNANLTLDCSRTTIYRSGTTMTINWSIIPKTAFKGSKNIYIRAIDRSGADTNFILKGTRTIK